MTFSPLGAPRPPLIPPPSFFGVAPSSNIKQRGPPAHSFPSQFLPLNANASVGPRSSGKRLTNGPITASVPKRPCVVLANVPDTATDSELAQFLRIHISRINDSM